MSEENAFLDFIRRIRAGDAAAAEELVRQYEPAIRLEVSLRLADRRLRRLFDSMDVCQSVLASFFVRAAAGQYDLSEPGQLVRLLVVMARHKVARRARDQGRARRDYRRAAALEGAALDAAAAGASPSQLLGSRELLGEVRRLLSDEERRLADLRAEGREWAEIAAAVGGTPGARRKQLARALDRVAAELGLEEGVADSPGTT